MFIYNKSELDAISREASNLADEITEYAEGLVTSLKDADRDIESKVSSVKDLIDSIGSKLQDSDLPFSERFRKRIRKVLDDYDLSLEEELEGLKFDFDGDEILRDRQEYSDPEDYLNSIDFFKNLNSFEVHCDNLIFYLDKIEDFMRSPKRKVHHFVMERRSGLLAIKDRKHPDYGINKDGYISIDNGEVYCIFNGEWDPNTGWSVPENVIESCRKTIKKLNSL